MALAISTASESEQKPRRRQSSSNEESALRNRMDPM